jgi:hypothetical protein
VSRLVLLLQGTPHLKGDEAETWLREQLGLVAGQRGIVRVSLSRLESVSSELMRGFDWLIELECSAVEDATSTSCGGAFVELFTDLRLIGMRPSLAFANHPVDVNPTSSA